MTIPDVHFTAIAPPIPVFGAFRYGADHGRIASKPDLIEEVWGRTFATETSLTERISLELRVILGSESLLDAQRSDTSR